MKRQGCLRRNRIFRCGAGSDAAFARLLRLNTSSSSSTSSSYDLGYQLTSPVGKLKQRPKLYRDLKEFDFQFLKLRSTGGLAAMGLLTINYGRHSSMGGKCVGFNGAQSLLPPRLLSVRYTKLMFQRSKFGAKALSSRKSVKKPKRQGQQSKDVVVETNKSLSEGSSVITDQSSHKDDNARDGSNAYNNSTAKNSISVASRGNVLQACTITSGLLAALGLIIRQVSHFASMEGLPILDSSLEVSFGFEMWHLELIIGLVLFISSCRYLLLKSWPDFAESSEAANSQVLTSLQPLDYLLVAFLPGVSEELLFRGALLPIFGFDLKSVILVAAIFGVLHLGSGRKYSFAMWATFVGFVYGYATIISSSIVVPMASHALNNLVGGILWRQTSKSLE